MENYKQIKTYEDALRVLGKKDFSHENLYPREIARRKLEIIIEAFNEGWEPDWEDYSQLKWYPNFHRSFTGLWYSNSYASPAGSHSYISVRLCCKLEKISDYVGQQFLYLYKEMLLG